MSSSLIWARWQTSHPSRPCRLWSSTFQAETTSKMSADSERRRKRRRKDDRHADSSFPLSREDMGLNLHLSDWECLQRGLVILRKHGNALTEANVLRVAPILLDGRFADAESVSKEMGLKGKSSGTLKSGSGKEKKNLGLVMKQILHKRSHGAKLKRLKNALFNVIRANEKNITRNLLLSSFATAVVFSAQISETSLSDREIFLNCAKELSQQIPELALICKEMNTSTNLTLNEHVNDSNEDGNDNIINMLPFMFSPDVLHQLGSLIAFPKLKRQLDDQLYICTPYRIIKAAYDAALRGNQRGAKHGAVLFDKNGNVLSVGWNHRYNVPIKKTGTKVMHAEVRSLLYECPIFRFYMT